MKNLHIIYSNFDIIQVKILEKHGIKVQAKYDRFDIEENETYWILKPYLDKWEISDFVVSKFSKEEEEKAKHLLLLSPWANGYPMNDYDRSYLKTTYNDSDFCNTCGMGLVQKEPFRLKKAPNWGGSKKMFSLNWIYDEIFVKDSFYQEIFSEYGIVKEKVLLYKKESVISDTVQLIIPTTEFSLKLEGYKYEICKDCSRKRYDLINKGFFPAFEGDVSNLPLFKSKEWFGTGASARKYIFVSAELRKKLVKSKVNANYIPCQ